MEEYLVILLLKLAVAAAGASILVRFEAFTRLLLVEERSLTQRVVLACSIAAVFGGGVAIRVITGTYKAADTGLEGCLLAGLVGGYVSGLLAGVLIPLPAMYNGEYLAMPVFAAVGVVGGLVRDAASGPEDVWRASPFLDLNVYRIIRRWPDYRNLGFHLFLLAVMLAAELVRYASATEFPRRYLFTLYGDAGPVTGWTLAAFCLTTLLTVMLPVKIWNNARTEKKLDEQRILTQEARLRALTSQINPHFLFNTLNTVTSLIRTDPDQARVVVQKLSHILRRLMRETGNAVALRDEIAFIDNYLSIEMVRFGDKLRFIKEIDPEALDETMPSMILQPVIENSLKHGLATKIEGGCIRLRVRRTESGLQILVEDDGVGIPEANLAKLFEQGIGISNVNERLKVLFGTGYRMWIDSRPGEGTTTGFEIPTKSS